MQVVSTTTTLAVRQQRFSTDEELALTGFLGGYRGLTREAYQLDLRQYVQWCTEHHLTLFGARRADIESFGRHLEARGRARATIARRLCTVVCFSGIGPLWLPLLVVLLGAVGAVMSRRSVRQERRS